MKMTILLLSLFGVFFSASSSYAGKKIKTKKRTCDQLIETVIAKETAHLAAYFSSAYVHSSAAKCPGHWQEAVESFWPSKDTKRCMAGYICRHLPDNR